MPDQQMGKQNPIFFRNFLIEIFFNLNGILGFRPAEEIGQPSDVSIDDHSGGNSKGISQDHIGRFSAHPWELDELFHRLRNSTLVLLDQSLGTADDIFRFVFKKSSGSDDFFDFRRVRSRQSFCGWKFFEQDLSHNIDPHVSALGRQDCRYQ